MTAYAVSTFGRVDRDDAIARPNRLMDEERPGSTRTSASPAFAAQVGPTPHQLSEPVNTQFGVGFALRAGIASRPRGAHAGGAGGVRAVGRMSRGRLRLQSNFYAAFREVTGGCRALSPPWSGRDRRLTIPPVLSVPCLVWSGPVSSGLKTFRQARLQNHIAGARRCRPLLDHSGNPQVLVLPREVRGDLFLPDQSRSARPCGDAKVAPSTAEDGGGHGGDHGLLRWLCPSAGARSRFIGAPSRRGSPLARPRWRTQLPARRAVRHRGGADAAASKVRCRRRAACHVFAGASGAVGAPAVPAGSRARPAWQACASRLFERFVRVHRASPRFAPAPAKEAVVR